MRRLAEDGPEGANEVRLGDVGHRRDRAHVERLGVRPVHRVTRAEEATIQILDLAAHAATLRHRPAPCARWEPALVRRRHGAMRQLLGALLLGVILVGCGPEPADAGASIEVVVVAGPTCPVVSDPPDPGCDDRPVEGAIIVVRDDGGAEVARIVTDASGEASTRLAPGTFTLEPQPVDGLMGTAAPVEVTVERGAQPDPIVVAYDTGIR